MNLHKRPNIGKHALICMAALMISQTLLAREMLRGRLRAEEGTADFEGYVIWIHDGDKLPEIESPGGEHSMSQINKSFSPPIVAIRKGDRVIFENLDNVFHNVFSLDKRNPFDLGLFKGRKHFSADFKKEIPGSASISRRYSKGGKYFVFCNIHPDMVGTVFVFDHGYYAQADKNGLFSIPSPGAGHYTLVVDGTRLEEPLKLPIDVTHDNPLLDVKLKLSKSAKKIEHTKKDGQDYGAGGGSYP